MKKNEKTRSNDDFFEKPKNKYYAESHKGGYCVKTVTSGGVILYTDRDGLWMRSKKNLSPMTYEQCKVVIQNNIAIDEKNDKEWKL